MPELLELTDVRRGDLLEGRVAVTRKVPVELVPVVPGRRAELRVRPRPGAGEMVFEILRPDCADVARTPTASASTKKVPPRNQRDRSIPPPVKEPIADERTSAPGRAEVDWATRTLCTPYAAPQVFSAKSLTTRSGSPDSLYQRVPLWASSLAHSTRLARRAGSG